MPIRTFNDNTFVAFIDICGFKEMMRQEQRAVNNLCKFYNDSYHIIKHQNRKSCKVNGIFVSDCGILFVRQGRNHIIQLEALLKIIKEIINRMIEIDIMLTISIAYGPFLYEDRIELMGMRKSFLMGNAYVWAYFDNEDGLPKIQPGQCRILSKNLPHEIKVEIENGHNNNFKMIRKGIIDTEHYYYYWMLQNPHEIDKFEKEYNFAYNSHFSAILNVLKRKPNLRQNFDDNL